MKEQSKKAKQLAQSKAKATREANPQFSHLVSKAKKKELSEFKSNGKKNLIESKRQSDLFKVDTINKYENAILLKKCKTLINKVAKDSELLSLSIQAVRRNKNGTFSPYYFAQLVQKVVKLVDTKGHDFKSALNRVIAEKNTK